MLAVSTAALALQFPAGQAEFVILDPLDDEAGAANPSKVLADLLGEGGPCGMHRALFHNEHLGTLETFRPYALPDPAWIEEIAAKFPQFPRA